ncbi:MAG: T9SS type A sorting domain-containing protein, partial [Bacteroidota bacterium]
VGIDDLYVNATRFDSVTNVFSGLSTSAFPGMAIAGSEFNDCGTVFSGYLSNIDVSGCTFNRANVAIDLGNASNFSVYSSTFIDNGIAIEGVGNHTGFIEDNIFEDNLVAVNFIWGGGPPYFRYNQLKNNGVNAQIETNQALNLANNCWGEVDSMAILSTFDYVIGNASNLSLSPFSVDCIPGLVFPGDTDHDQLCDLTDLFPIGIYYGFSGPARQNASLQWQGQIANDWADTLANGQNIKHVDTDGDGIINLADTLAILLNYGLTHQNPRPAGSMTGDAKLSFASLPNTIMPDEVISLPVYLGTMDSSLEDLYGFFFEFDYDTSLIRDIKLSSTNSWFGTEDNDMLGITRISAGRLGAVYVRIDGTDVDGYGEIGQLQITMASSLPDSFDISLISVRQAGIKRDESPINILGESLNQTIYTSSVGVERSAIAGLQIYPNPSEGKFVLQSEQYLIEGLSLYNTNGQILLKEAVGKYTWNADVSHLPKGLYLLKVDTDSGVWQEKLIVR